MQRSFKRIITGVVFFAVTNVVAISGYVAAGWKPLDATYMTVITIFGVGYGEVQPLSPKMRLFTIGVILAGFWSAAYIVSGSVQLLAEGEINRALQLRRMDKEIDNLENHTIICGFGHVGEILAAKLTDDRHSFVAIDIDSDRVAHARELGYWVRCGSASDEEILKSAGVEKAKVLATVLPDDANNVFITLTARGLNPDLTIVARGTAPSTEHKLKLAGADRVVMPAAIGALRMAHTITHPASEDLLSNAEGMSFLNEELAQLDARIDELPIPGNSPLVGRTLEDIERQSKGRFIAVAVRRADGQLISRPESALTLERDDTIIVIGRSDAVPQLTAYYNIQRKAQYRGSRL
ncbi:MAG: TrkA family potassium uptake protein [Synechococcus sp.]